MSTTVEVGASAEALLAQVGEALAKGDKAAAAVAVDKLLAQDGEHLEGWVARALVAELRGNKARAQQSWQRVERVLVYRGKTSVFALERTLFAAARHYIEADNRERADLFLEELLRRFPLGDSSARSQLLIAERAFARRQYSVTIETCKQLERVTTRHAASTRCRGLRFAAERLRNAGVMAGAGARRWRWLSPGVTANTLRGVWIGKRALFAVGEAGTIVRRAGRKTELMKSGTRWALNGVGGSPGGAVYAVGAGGVVLALDSEKADTWRVLRAPKPHQADLYGVYSARSGHAACVGASGTLLEMSGGSKLAKRTIAKVNLRGVTGFGPSDLWIVGDEGTLLRVEGAGAAKRLRSDTYEDLWGIAPVANKGHVHAVGSKRTWVYHDGKRAKEDIVSLVHLRGVTATGVKQAFAVGTGGAALRWDGRKWRQERTGTALDLLGVAGRGGRVLAVGAGGTLLRRAGSTWRVEAGGVREHIVGVSSGLSPALVLGARGLMMTRRKGGRWTRATLPVLGTYGALYAQGKRFVAVGAAGLVVVREGASYRRVKSGTVENLHGVWGYPGGLVAVGNRGAIVRGADGALQVDRSPTGLRLRGVHGRSARDIVIVGNRGVVLRWRGAGWSTEQSHTLRDLHAVYMAKDEIIAVGAGGVVARRRGRANWTVEQSPIARDLIAVRAQRDGTFLALSRGGEVLRIERDQMVLEDSPAACLRALGSDAQGDPLAAGCYGGVIAPAKALAKPAKRAKPRAKKPRRARR
ncbi:MAG: hypothetical protein KC503_09850 [Myxococcales bacterium]|nr:hypothetical protein [Myxococcales bacterium]